MSVAAIPDEKNRKLELIPHGGGDHDQRRVPRGVPHEVGVGEVTAWRAAGA